ncbi:MAG: major capsid protein [Microvirus sp.]|nr:MAG: major capsid protein [Microvirus sp.]
MKNIFNSVKFPSVDSNRFDLSHDLKLSFSMGELIPTCVLDCLPGDKVNISVENMLRFAPLISPVMHKVDVTTHYFFVPNRLLWAEWEKWITGDSDVEAPFVTVGPGSDVGTVIEGSIADYIGIPTGEYLEDVKVSPMAFAAYLKVFDEYYRDQNLQSEVFVPLVPGANDDYLTSFTDSPLHRAWQHDYFTAALPFAQKGDSVQLPLTTANDVPVEFKDRGAENLNAGGAIDASTGLPVGAIGTQSDYFANGPSPLGSSWNIDGVGPIAYDPRGTLVVDVQSDATDINTLRRAFKLQEWLEKNARGGTRYVENILAHFGIKSSDARLQRPEYIGGSKQNMVISEVLATAENTEAGVAVGQMAGHGISVGGGNRFNYRCEEHGYIIGFINVQPVTAYQDGLHRSFSRFSRLDYAWPTFANIGEQEVLQKEVKARVAVNTDPDRVFGYVPRYSEYKFMNSRVSGEMRSSLNFWHLGRIFANDPALNEVFISAFPSTRIFAVTDENTDHIYAHIFNNISAVRKLPKYGIPQI